MCKLSFGEDVVVSLPDPLENDSGSKKAIHDTNNSKQDQKNYDHNTASVPSIRNKVLTTRTKTAGGATCPKIIIEVTTAQYRPNNPNQRKEDNNPCGTKLQLLKKTYCYNIYSNDRYKVEIRKLTYTIVEWNRML